MIQRILTALLGLGLFIVALFVTSLLVAAVLATVLLTWTWARWRSRHDVPIRAAPASGGRVIEGEYRRIDSR